MSNEVGCNQKMTKVRKIHIRCSILHNLSTLSFASFNICSFLFFSRIISKAFATVESLAIDESKCGISSAQNFSGEDRNKYETDRAKKEEMRRWVKERLSAEDYQRMCEKVENMNYAALLQTVDAMRGNIEKIYDNSLHAVKFVPFSIFFSFLYLSSMLLLSMLFYLILLTIHS